MSNRKEHLNMYPMTNRERLSRVLEACKAVRRMNLCTCCAPNCVCGNHSDPCPLCEFRLELELLDPTD